MRRATDERAILGPRKAVPNTAVSRATARAAAPNRPRGALTAPVAATIARIARTRATPVRSQALSITMVASAEPAGTRCRRHSHHALAASPDL